MLMIDSNLLQIVTKEKIFKKYAIVKFTRLITSTAYRKLVRGILKVLQHREKNFTTKFFTIRTKKTNF